MNWGKRALRQHRNEAPMSRSQENVSSSPASINGPVKYGELIILGYNGFVPDGEEVRGKTHFALYQRLKANGLKPSTVHKNCNQQKAKWMNIMDQYSISYTLSQDSTVVVEYAPDSDMDMFQIGRSKESPNDFVVTDKTPPSRSKSVVTRTGRSKESPNDFVVTDRAPRSKSGAVTLRDGVTTVSRFACRVICQRSPPYTAHIYAAGFDSSKNIFLGENALKCETPDGQMDGLTTNGVLVRYPLHGVTQDSKPGLWKEISVCGNVYTRRDTFFAQKRLRMVERSQELVDGSLIDLCGLTLLWRTAEGLARMPTMEVLRKEFYSRPRGPVVSPSLRCKEVMDSKAEVKVRPEDGAGILRDPQREVCELTLDPNTAHIKISLSKNNRKVTRAERDQKYLDHPDRFKDYGQVMCRQNLTGHCYFEVKWSGGVDIAVTYKGINRQGDDSQFGYNDKSWSLRCSGGENSYTVWHNKKKTNLSVSPSSRSGRVAVNVDWPAGTVSFYTVSTDTLTHLHTFNSTFTEPLYAGFWVGWSDSSVCVC